MKSINSTSPCLWKTSTVSNTSKTGKISEKENFPITQPPMVAIFLIFTPMILVIAWINTPSYRALIVSFVSICPKVVNAPISIKWSFTTISFNPKASRDISLLAVLTDNLSQAPPAII